MEINRPSPLLTPSPEAAIKPVVNAWRAGQILNASVAEPPRGSKVLLNIQNTVIEAQIKLPTSVPPLPNTMLQKGHALKLEVIKTDTTPTLKLLTQRQPEEPKLNAIKNDAPKQRPLPPLLANLANIVNHPQNARSAIPERLFKLIAQLMDHLPTPQSLSSAQQVKQALKDSGALLENKLAEQARQLSQQQDPKNATQRVSAKQSSETQSLPQLNSDLKANLLRLANGLMQASVKPTVTGSSSLAQPPSTQSTSTLQTTPLPPQPRTRNPYHTASRTPLPPQYQTPSPLTTTNVQAQAREIPSVNLSSPLETVIFELLQQVEGAVSRMRLTQLLHTPGEPQQTGAFSFELPVRDQDRIDLFHLRLEEDASRSVDKKNKNWTITLAFDFDELGPMYAKLTIGGKHVGAILTAEKDATLTLIAEHAEKLCTSLAEAGLEVSHLNYSKGTLPMSGSATITQTLVDTTI